MRPRTSLEWLVAMGPNRAGSSPILGMCSMCLPRVYLRCRSTCARLRTRCVPIATSWVLRVYITQSAARPVAQPLHRRPRARPRARHLPDSRLDSRLVPACAQPALLHRGVASAATVDTVEVAIAAALSRRRRPIVLSAFGRGRKLRSQSPRSSPRASCNQRRRGHRPRSSPPLPETRGMDASLACSVVRSRTVVNSSVLTSDIVRHLSSCSVQITETSYLQYSVGVNKREGASSDCCCGLRASIHHSPCHNRRNHHGSSPLRLWLCQTFRRHSEGASARKRGKAVR